MKTKFLKQLFLGLAMVLSMGAWGQNEATNCDCQRSMLDKLQNTHFNSNNLTLTTEWLNEPSYDNRPSVNRNRNGVEHTSDAQCTDVVRHINPRFLPNSQQIQFVWYIDPVTINALEQLLIAQHMKNTCINSILFSVGVFNVTGFEGRPGQTQIGSIGQQTYRPEKSTIIARRELYINIISNNMTNSNTNFSFTITDANGVQQDTSQPIILNDYKIHDNSQYVGLATTEQFNQWNSVSANSLPYFDNVYKTTVSYQLMHDRIEYIDKSCNIEPLSCYGETINYTWVPSSLRLKSGVLNYEVVDKNKKVLKVYSSNNNISDIIFINSYSKFKKAVLDVTPPNFPNGSCFSFTVKRSGGVTQNGGYWVSMFRKELKITLQTGWNLRPLNWPSNVTIINSSRVGNTYTYILESTETGTFYLPISMFYQNDTPCNGLIPIYLMTVGKLSQVSNGGFQKTP